MPYLSPLFRRTPSPSHDHPPQTESRCSARIRGCRENSLHATQPDLHGKRRISPYSPFSGRRDARRVQTHSPITVRRRWNAAAALALILAFSGSLVAQNSLTARWTANPETDIVGYKVYLGTTSGTYSTIQTVTNGTSVVLTGLTPSTTYYCAVQAYNTSGVTSEMSDEVVKTTAAAAPTFPEIAVSGPSGADLASGTGSVPCGSALVGNPAAQQTITLRNTGDANLTGLALSIEGANASDFSTSALATTTLAPGASTTIAITLQPTAAGARAATLKIASNDADENPFSIPLSGEGLVETVTPAPEIAVLKADGTDLADGGSSVNFGPLNLGAAGVPQTFTIRNQGNAVLSGISASINGAHAADFTLGGGVSTTVAAGGGTSLTVTFKPSATGTRSATLHILSNDANEASFDIALAGDGVAVPEIVVEQPENTALVDGSAAVSFGPLNLGATGVSRTFVIRNTGTAALSGLAATVDGSHAADFTVSGFSATSIAASASATLTVTFKPGAAGTRSASLHVASNDADENPFDIALTGSGVAVPEIAVENNEGAGLTDNNSTVAFSALNLGAAGETRAIVIRNTGTAALSGIAVSIDGADFTASAPGATTLAAGASTTFNVTFKPLAAGSRSGVLRIASNDADENPFDVKLAGTGIAVPEIAVEQPEGSSLSDGNATIAFSSLTLGAAGDAKTFVIRNTGTAALSGIAVSIDGADFTASAPGATSLAAGTSTTFSVTFKPSAAGPRTALLRIASNDADENPFDIALSGNGVAVPEIVVEQPENIGLTDGSATVSFGSVLLGAAGTTKTFVIRNSGTAALSGIAVSIDGANAADFTTTGLDGTSIAAGTSATFTLTFKPSAAGPRSAALRIASNDSDESPFDIALTGNGGTAPEIAVTRPEGAELKSGDATLSFGEIKLEAAAATAVLILRNQGTAALTGIASSITGDHSGDFTVTSPAVSTLAPGAGAELTISFKPTSAGARAATLRITSNDADENPFTILLRGGGIATPDIDVRFTDEVASNNFGRVDLRGQSNPRGLTIRNLGSADLVLKSVTSTGKHAADFILTGPEIKTLPPGASTTFSVVFKPSAAGERVAKLLIESNDPDENPFAIAVFGIGLAAPEINVAIAGGEALSNGGSVSFGEVDSNSESSAKTIRITNTGTAVLEGLKVRRQDGSSPSFIVGDPGETRLPPGESTTFKVTFRPTKAGLRTETIQITSNDGNESRFAIVLEGRGVAVPVIAVKVTGSGLLEDGDAFVSYGTAKRGVKTFTITNNGEATLRNLSIEPGGTDIGDFTIAPLRKKSLEPGQSTSFRVVFDASTSRTVWAALQIRSNDPKTGIFDIVLTRRDKGAASSKSAKTRGEAKADTENGKPTVSFVIVGGQKFRCITIPKTAGGNISARSVQVSGDLVDWFSGKRHTTVIKDNANVLKVRDNTPVEPGSKRYIRLK